MFERWKGKRDKVIPKIKFEKRGLMGYRSVVISSSVRITVKNEQLVIEGENSGSVPIEDIRTLMLESRSSTITTYALSSLSEAGVCVFVCDEKHLPSAIIQPVGRHFRQRKQILTQLSQSKPHLKRMWQEIVVSKIKNQAKCLELCGVDSEYFQKVDRLSNLVQSGDTTNIEGQAAALYFRYLFGKEFSRGQDSDINSALNYGYAILRGYIARTLANYGYEPCIGIHHHSELNNYNFADDLIEPFRPLVDLFVFQNMTNTEFSTKEKRELCNILNYELVSGDGHHSAAYAVERLIHSIERSFTLGYEADQLLLPKIEELRRHNYE